MRGPGGESPSSEYERYRAAVMAMLAKRFPRLDDDERLAIYHDAWTRVLAKRERREPIGSLRAYLLATAGAEALHTLSRGRIPTPVGPDDPRVEALTDGAPPLDEQVVTRDQARIARGLLDTLDERQRDVLKLRWDLQLSTSEVRAALDLSERQYRRLAEEGATALARRVEELESGHWSRRTRSLLVACLVEVTADGERRVGIASRRQRAEAQRLLESDPHVAALYAEVRRSVRGAAALLPLPVLRLGSTDDSLLGQLASAIQALKQQATSLYIRVSDPTLLTGGPRPGAAIVAATGAIALGGGTYSAYDALSKASPPPTPAATSDSVVPPASPRPSMPKAVVPHRPSRTSRPATTPAPPSNPEPPITPEPSIQPQPQPTSPPPQPTPPSQPTEFGFEN